MRRILKWALEVNPLPMLMLVGVGALMYAHYATTYVVAGR